MNEINSNLKKAECKCNEIIESINLAAKRDKVFNIFAVIIAICVSVFVI